MDTDEQERALQPFGQAKPATTRTYGGTGLGLPITKGLIEAHGGALTILSRLGEGTTVRLVLPTQMPSPVLCGDDRRRDRIPPRSGNGGRPLIRETYRSGASRAAARLRRSWRRLAPPHHPEQK